MSQIGKGIEDIGYLDDMADGDTPVHRLDPRAKVVTTIIFVVLVMSFDRYEIARLLPYFLLPVVIIAVAGFPYWYFIRKILFVSPFVFFVAVFNPFLETEPMLQLGPLVISAGWVSFFSILIRFVLTVGAVLVLVASTGFSQVCRAFEQIGMPNIFAVQLLFLYRYIFVLMSEGSRMIRSHGLRSFGRKLQFSIFVQLAGNLLLRTIDRAQRIHMAMLCRGFDGEIRSIRQSRFGKKEMLCTFGVSAVLVVLRTVNIPQWLGTFFLEFLQ